MTNLQIGKSIERVLAVKKELSKINPNSENPTQEEKSSWSRLTAENNTLVRALAGQGVTFRKNKGTREEYDVNFS